MLPRAPRVALITGASSGIGLWTARGLAAHGDHILLVCRDRKRGIQARDWLIHEMPHALVELYLADLSSQSEIVALAQNVCARHDRLDLLINNAGCFNRHWHLTSEGIELTMAVNYLAPFLLTSLMLPLLQKNAEHSATQIINIGSASADRTRLDWRYLRQERPTGMLAAYAQTKLALLIYSFHLARRLDSIGITVNCLHPGVIATQIGQVGGFIGVFWSALKPLLPSARRGAVSTLTVATDDLWKTRSGCYVKSGRAISSNPLAHDLRVADQLLKLSTGLLRNEALQTLRLTI